MTPSTAPAPSNSAIWLRRRDSMRDRHLLTPRRYGRRMAGSLPALLALLAGCADRAAFPAGAPEPVAVVAEFTMPSGWQRVQLDGDGSYQSDVISNGTVTRTDHGRWIQEPDRAIRFDGTPGVLYPVRWSGRTFLRPERGCRELPSEVERGIALELTSGSIPAAESTDFCP